MYLYIQSLNVCFIETVLSATVLFIKPFLCHSYAANFYLYTARDAKQKYLHSIFS